MSVFSNVNNNCKMILGAYKKLKSFYYYDKTQIHNKTKISEWENDSHQMDVAINNLAISLKELGEGRYDENIQYLLKNINQIILPKKFEKTEKISEDTICNKPEQNPMNSVNFFIDAPLELLILDMIWSLFISKIAYDKKIISKSVFANRTKDSSLFQNKGGLFESIDFESNRFFKPYFIQYSKWKNKAFDLLRKRYYDQEDSVLITLDIKSYYYNVDFDFDSMNDIFGDDKLDEFKELTSLLKLIYQDYSKNLFKYRNNQNDKIKTVLPIGLVSSSILANIYLDEFDRKIESLQPVYYGRYVDDIMLVFDAKALEKKRLNSKKNIIMDTLVEKHILRTDKDDYSIVSFDSLYLTNDKIKSFYIDSKESSSLIDMIYEYGCVNISEYNLQPELPLIGSEADNYFDLHAYKLRDIDGSFKLRDFKMAHNSFHAIRCINFLTIASKSINSTDEANFEFSTFISKQFKQIIQFFSGSNAIEYKTAWLNVFMLALTNQNYVFAVDFYKMIHSQILDLHCDSLKDVKNENVQFIVERVKKQLGEHLRISFATSLASFPENDKIKQYDFPDDMEIILRLTKSIRKANMFNHHSAVLPLQNYYKSEILEKASDYIKDVSLLKSFRLCSNCSKSCELIDFLDERKLNLSPRFLHLHEIHLAHFSFTFCSGGNIFADKLNSLFDFYKTYNNIPFAQKPYNEKIVTKRTVDFQNVYIDDKVSINKEDFKIALASIYIDEFDHVIPTLDDPYKGMYSKQKNELTRMLNEAKSMGANVVVFPEYFLPFGWSDYVSRFAKEQNIIIITGMQYLTHIQDAYNYVGIFIPIVDSKNFKHCIPIFREKNDYAPLEQILLSHKGYKFRNNNKAQLRTLSINGVSLSDILCFELTNLDYRSYLKGNVDLLFVPELNKDTNYFSSIIESSSRDMYCFAIQSNTSKYGDSRILAPYGSQHKNIVQIKGGHNNVLLLGKINILEMQNERKNSYLKLKERVKNEFGDISKFEEDKKKHEKEKYKPKDLPARFYRK